MQGRIVGNRKKVDHEDDKRIAKGNAQQKEQKTWMFNAAFCLTRVLLISERKKARLVDSGTDGAYGDLTSPSQSVKVRRLKT